MNFLNYLNSIFSLQAEPKQEPKPRKKAVSNAIVRENIAPADVELQSLKLAVMQAQDIEEPNRTQLYSIYEQISKDSHFLSQYRTALYTVQQSPFIVYQNKKESEYLKELLDKGWFTNFIKHVLDSEFWGHSLIELSDIKEGEFTKTTLINRYHVVPEYGVVKIRFNDEISDAIPYRKNLTAWQLIEVGEPTDLGLLEVIAREVIWKTYSKSDWSQFIDRYGMPLLAIRTDTQDAREINKMIDFSENFGGSGYIIASKDDEIQMLQGRQGSGDQEVFEAFIAECKDAISMLVNGQTGTADEKSYVGAAEVHERILNKYTLARLERIQRVINDKLIPFLNYWGYPFNDVKFQYEDLLPKNIAPVNTKKEDEKKKSELSLNEFYAYAVKLNYELSELKLSGKFAGIFNRMIKELHRLAGTKKLPDNLLEIEGAGEMIIETAKTFEKAVEKSFKASFNSDDVFIQKLTQSVWVFSGFKTYRQLKDLSAKLHDKDGKVKPFYRFRDEVLSIHKDYNINWLNAEYKQAVAASQTASRWRDFEKQGDRYYLQYRTASDERVRASHTELHGITLPLNDAFWNEFYPPNGWGCRCTVVQVLKSRYEKTDSKKALERGKASMIVTNSKGEINEKATRANQIFRFNPGKTAALFPIKHPYYQESKSISKIIKHKALELLNIEIARKEYNEYGKDYIKHYFNNKSGGYVVYHKKHGKIELSDNLKTAKILAENAYKIVLTENIENKISADALLNGEVCEFKLNKTPTINAIDTALRSGNKQARIIVINIESSIKKGDLINAITDRVRRTKIKRIIIIKDNKVYDYKRGVLLNNDIKIE